MIVHAHMYSDDPRDPLKTFLSLIILEMLPLLCVEVKILQCEDPVNLFCKFGPKVLLMHASFLLLRVCCHPFAEIGSGLYNLFGLVAACFTLHFGFKYQLSLQSIRENRDVWCLLCLAGMAGWLTQELDEYFEKQSDPEYHRDSQYIFERVIATTSDYIEVLAFVPAVWIVYRTGKVLDPLQLPKSSSKRKTSFLFAFLIAFYFTEDVLTAISLGAEVPLVAAGHVIHFLLVLDFACFLLAHIYDPEKLKDSILTFFPE